MLTHRRGVCQDFAHLMLAVCRTAGVPARYVSGYLYTEKPPEGSFSGLRFSWTPSTVNTPVPMGNDDVVSGLTALTALMISDCR